MKILQIIPAPGWYAKYREEDGSETISAMPLVCWALCEDEAHGGTFVEGCDVDELGEIELAPEASNFCGYVYKP